MAVYKKAVAYRLGLYTAPPTLAKDQREIGTAIAAKLSKLNSHGDLKVQFKNEVEENFAKLSDSNAALYLFLKAIDCILDKPTDAKHPDPLREELARSMVETVRRKWGAENDVQSASGPLSPFERTLIQKASPVESQFIQATLQKYGYLEG
jgi:hypothetical protein